MIAKGWLQIGFAAGLVVCSGVTAHAGGYTLIAADALPYTWPNNTPTSINVDMGPFAGIDHETVKAASLVALQQWQNTHSGFIGALGSDVPVDIDTVAEMLTYVFNNTFNPSVPFPLAYVDSQVFADLGFGSNVLGFAGFSFVDSQTNGLGHVIGAIAAFSETFILEGSQTPIEFLGVLTHEFGHALGLAHIQLNGGLYNGYVLNVTGGAQGIQANVMQFSPEPASFSGNLAFMPGNDIGCDSFTGSFAGNIALMRRGTCSFVQKVTNAQAAGASGAIIINNVTGGFPFSGAGDPGADHNIPSFMVGNVEGESLIQTLGFVTLTPSGVGADAVETMYPIAVAGEAEFTPHMADRVLFNAVYPSSSFYPSSGFVGGTVFTSDLSERYDGAVIIARNIANPFLDAVQFTSGNLNTDDGQGGPFGGLYVLPGLTPGAQYSIQMGPIDPSFTGGSNVGNFTTPPVFPGVREYYNAANESGNPSIDNPNESVTVSASAGAVDFSRNLIINGEETVVANAAPSFSQGGVFNLSMTTTGFNDPADSYAAIFFPDGSFRTFTGPNALSAPNQLLPFASNQPLGNQQISLYTMAVDPALFAQGNYSLGAAITDPGVSPLTALIDFSLAPFAVGPPAGATEINESEPNDTPATADPLGTLSGDFVIRGSVNSSNFDDFFSFTVPSTRLDGAIVFGADLTYLSGRADVDILILDAAGEFIYGALFSGRDDGETGAFKIDLTEWAGETLLMLVEHFDGGTVNYELRLYSSGATAASDDCDDCTSWSIFSVCDGDQVFGPNVSPIDADFDLAGGTFEMALPQVTSDPWLVLDVDANGLMCSEGGMQYGLSFTNGRSFIPFDVTVTFGVYIDGLGFIGGATGPIEIDGDDCFLLEFGSFGIFSLLDGLRGLETAWHPGKGALLSAKDGTVSLEAYRSGIRSWRHGKAVVPFMR